MAETVRDPRQHRTLAEALSVAAPVPSAGADAWEACYVCHGHHRWRSTAGATLCARCHPPAVPELVAEWIDEIPPGAADEPGEAR